METNNEMTIEIFLTIDKEWHEIKIKNRPWGAVRKKIFRSF
jgi:hypothetical protein